MRKFLLLILTGLSSYMVMAQSTIPVKLDSKFSLDPIRGICGNEYEGNSKFVQRFIFSPLVLPMQDPFLQTNYEISRELSLIEETIEYSNDGNIYSRYDTRNAGDSNPPAKYFKVRLRAGLKFYKYDRNRTHEAGSLTAEDVVFSYRMARVTSDRIYHEYLRQVQAGQSVPPLELNTLLYSKIKIINDVYCKVDDDRDIYFTMDDFSALSCTDFLKYLVFVPILSVDQLGTSSMKRSSSNEYGIIHSQWNMKDLVFSGEITKKDYNMYDLNHSANASKVESFFKQPIGYGQYLVESPLVVRKEKRQRLYQNAILRKNKYWCDFTSTGPAGINHRNYKNDNTRIEIVYDPNKSSISTRINNLYERTNVNEIIYNVPVSLYSFDRDKHPDFSDTFRTIKKQKMQISHNLYGILFGPDISSSNNQDPININARIFFSKFANRPVMENMVKFGTNADSYDPLLDQNSSTGKNNLFSDLVIKKLYYPFYLGDTNPSRSGSELDKLYGDLEKNDLFSQDYSHTVGAISLGDYYTRIRNNDVSDTNTALKQFARLYLEGWEMIPEVSDALKDEFNRLLSTRELVVNNNTINVKIDYKSNDEICRQLALLYKRLLETFFQNVVKVVPNIKCEEQGKDYDAWKSSAITNKRNGFYTLYVYGWNYKLDLLNDLNHQFIEQRETYDVIKGEYQKLIDNSRLNVETIIRNIAERFSSRYALIPLVGIQNYSLFRMDNPVLKEFEEHSSLEMILFPYYWSK
jgi:hypothetical protein